MLKMSQTQLDDIFRSARRAKSRAAKAKGTAIVAPGTSFSDEIARFVNHFTWQGKSSIRTKACCGTRSCPWAQRDRREGLQG